MQLFENDRTHHYRNQTANEIYPKSFRLRFFNLEFVQPITIPGAKASFPLSLCSSIYRHSSFTFHVRVPVGTRHHDAS